MSSDHQALYSQIPAIDTLLRTPPYRRNTAVNS